MSLPEAASASPVPVVIAGGGPMGLALAALLGRPLPRDPVPDLVSQSRTPAWPPTRSPVRSG